MTSVRTWQDRHVGYLFILPATLMLVAVLVFPAFITLKLSLTPEGGKGWTFTLAHYHKAFRDPVLLQTFKNTFVFVAWSLAGHLAVGLALAMALNQALPGQTFFRLVALIPWTIPDVVAGIIFRWVLNPIHGCLNPLIQMVFPAFPAEFQWLSSPTLAFPSLIFANVWRGYPLVMVMLLAGLMAIPRDLYEAAEVDGAGRFKRFIHVTLPGLRTIIIIALALDMVWEFRRFALVLTMTGGGPGTLTEVLSTLVYKTYFQFFTFEYASAMAILMSAVLFILSLPYIFLVGRER
ncbi:MAG TPA: sugar ABC transporter permease [Thermodesulfobacteriota bacterium]|nr:sugar ABC transporter permease [Thermodesulfobacteriota bacterium]